MAIVKFGSTVFSVERASEVEFLLARWVFCNDGEQLFRCVRWRIARRAVYLFFSSVVHGWVGLHDV